MKKIIYALLFSLLFIGNITKVDAQSPLTIDLFCEKFDSVQTQWGMDTAITPTGADSYFLRDTLITLNGSSGSAYDTVGSVGSVQNRVTAFLTSPYVRVDSFADVNVSFEQICYISTFDDAVVEYNFKGDTLLNGASIWRRIPASAYQGPSTYDWAGDLKFCVASRPAKWQFGNNSYVWSPANSALAWEREDFNMTTLVMNELGTRTGVDTVVDLAIRFALIDDSGSPLGREGLYKWWIEDFCIKGGSCESIKPDLTLLDPPVNYPDRYEDRVYLLGPYIFDAKILDDSGIDTAFVVFQVKRDINNSPPPAMPNWVLIDVDTVPMFRLGGGNFRGTIPRLLPNGDSIQILDTVSWKVVTIDRSACENSKSDPRVGLTKFQVRPALPKSCGTQPIFDFPYYEDFNSFTTSIPPNAAEDLGGDWQNIKGDFQDWYVGAGQSIPPGIYGPTDDFPGGGKYLYVKSTSPSGGTYKDSTAFVLSPCIDLLDIPNGLIRFYLNMNTKGIEDVMRIDIFDPTPTPGFPDGGFVENVIPSVTGNKGDNWLSFELSTFPYRKTITQIRFVGTPGRLSGDGDMALDSFKIIQTATIDLRINSVDLGPFLPACKEDTLVANIQNLGIDTVKNFTINYQICREGMPCDPPAIAGQGQTWNGILLPGGSFNIKVTTPYNVPLGKYSVKAWINFANDQRVSNDTTFINSIGLNCDTLKYMDNFDGDSKWTVFTEAGSVGNKWELGTPSYDFTYSAYSKPNSWDILLRKPYTGTGRSTVLMSPFMDFSTADSVILSFINNRDIDKTRDGVYVEFSFDRGLQWDTLKATHDAGRLKWYNSTISAGGLGGSPVFAGTTYCYGNTWAGWLESEIMLPDTFDFQEEVLMRYSFFAEFDNDGNDGMSIDNVLVYDVDTMDLQAQHLLGPTSKCDLLPNQRINTIFKNRGFNTINEFYVDYIVTHVPSGGVEMKTDTVSRTVAFRDSVHVLSKSTFDMFVVGDYDVQVIARLPGDLCSRNDTLTQLVENIDGCSLQFYIETTHRNNFQLPCDSSVWRFSYTSGGRLYEVSEAYNWPANPINLPLPFVNDTIRDNYVCIKNNSLVRFDLNDIDTLIGNYSFVAFDGEQDTVLFDHVAGGPDSPTLFFKWDCPPQRSATPTKIYIDNDAVQLPISKPYNFAADILNNGTDSLDSFIVVRQVDKALTFIDTIRNVPELRYNRKKRVSLSSEFLVSGPHEICVWTMEPNGLFDMLPGDDTLCRKFDVMDTISTDTSGIGPRGSIYRPAYCEDFEGGSGLKWISADPYNLNQDVGSFEKGVPSSNNITTAHSGDSVWGTNVDGNYPNTDSTTLISPFFHVQKDSCYEVSFWYNYSMLDSIHDGFTLQMLSADRATYSDANWSLFGNSSGDSITNYMQVNWFNTKHILSIPNNQQNSGWTGQSNGWVQARNLLPWPSEDYFTALRWRFESDGSGVSDGVAIDDFCIENVHQSHCFAVGLNEELFSKSDLYLGQNIPNPAAYSTSIPYYLPKSGEVEFRVVNMLGQAIHFEKMTRPSGDGILELDLGNMAKGIYYYSMMFEGHRVTNKMIIAK